MALVVWIVGLSGSGKTTTGLALRYLLEKQGRCVVHLDGDEVRDIWSDEIGHSIEARLKNHTRLSKLSKLLGAVKELFVIVSALSIFPELQKWNKENIENYKLIFLDAGIDLVMERDYKGVYAKGTTGVIGRDLPFPQPYQPDLVVGEGELRADSPDAIARKIASFLTEHE